MQTLARDREPFLGFAAIRLESEKKQWRSCRYVSPDLQGRTTCAATAGTLRVQITHDTGAGDNCSAIEPQDRSADAVPCFHVPRWHERSIADIKRR